MQTNSTALRSRTGAPRWGKSIQNGDGSKKAFTIAHGLGAVPVRYWASARSDATFVPHTVTATATDIVVTFGTAPPAGTANLIFEWGADALHW